MVDYLRIINKYKRDIKRINNDSFCVTLSYIILCLTTMCLCFDNFVLFVLVFLFTIVGLLFSNTEVYDKFILKIIKKYNKNIEADEIYPIFKYDNYYVFKDWKVYPIYNSDKYYVTFTEEITGHVYYHLFLDNKSEFNISPKLYEKLSVMYGKDKYLIITEDEYQRLLSEYKLEETVLGGL